MNTLHLNLKKEWFDMILTGEKFVEYRDITEYWIRRLFYLDSCFDFDSGFDEIISEFNKDDTTLSSMCSFYGMKPRKFDTITFSNGFSKNRPQFTIKLKNINIGKGLSKWGAVKDKHYFCLELGEIIDKKNCL